MKASQMPESEDSDELEDTPLLARAAQRPQPIFHRATGDLRKPSPNLSPL